MKVKLRSVIITIGVSLLVVLCVCIGVTVFHHSKTLFAIDPSEVISVTVSNGDSKRTQVTITDQNEIEEIVELVNNFTYTSSENIPPADGCGYHISLKTKSGGVGFDFWENGVKVPDEAGKTGATINYYGKSGYFDSLVTLADNATDPM